MTKNIPLLLIAIIIARLTIYGQASNDLKNLNLRDRVKNLETNTYFLEVPNTEDFKNIKAGDYKVDYENGIRTFNLDGNVISHLKYLMYKGDIDKRIVYEYSTTGKFISVKIFNAKNEEQKNDRSEIADSSGRVIMEIENGQKTYDKKFKFNPDGTLDETIILLYNEQGETYQKQIEKNEYFKGTKIRKFHTEEYRHYSSNSFIGGVTYEYDTLGRILKFITNGQTFIGEGASIYTYNSNFDNDYVLKYYENHVLQKTQIVKCDKYDNVVSDVSIDNKGKITTIGYEYEYDSKGNWIKKINPVHDWSLGTYKQVTYRTIVYY
jgi:hypothetical protein